MFAIAHDLWMHSDHRSDPKSECLWAADTSGATHEIPNDSSHRFHRAGRAGQLQMRMRTIGPELFGSPEKFPNHHVDTARATRLTQQSSHTLQDTLELGTIRKLQRLTGKSVESLTHAFAYDFSPSPSLAALYLADEVKVTQLQDPAFVHGQGGNAPNLVGDQGANAFVQPYRNRVDGLHPTADFLPTRKKQRVQEESVVLVTRLQAHQVQDPWTSVEAKVKTVDQKYQWARESYNSGTGYRAVQESTETVTEGLRRKTAVLPRDIFQRPPMHKDCFEYRRRQSPRTTASFFLPDSPGALAVAALAASRAKTVNFRLTTTRFRVQCLHARELCLYLRPKSAKYQ